MPTDNGGDSKLALIVKHQGSLLQADSISIFLREHGFMVEMLYYNGGRTADALGHIDDVGNIGLLIAGENIPARELANAMPALSKVVTTNPEYKDTTHFNGGPRVVDVKYIAYDGASHNNTTKGIFKYLEDMYSLELSSPKASK